MPRLIIALIVIAAAWYFWNKLNTLPPEQRRGRILTTALWSILGVALLLVATGRAPWLVAAIAALGPLLKGLVSLAVRALPLLPVWLKSRQRKAEGSPTPPLVNDVNEAYLLLGLKPGATKEEVIQAHKKLIQKNHPDRGGNDYLAGKLNAAKDLLLEHIR